MNYPFVELRAAPLPGPLGWLADHHFFVIHEDPAFRERWEVWQSVNAGGESWGHVHRNLKIFNAGVGGGPSRVLRHWEGEEASRLQAVLHRPEAYPARDQYMLWPGPNSNTYVAWALREAGIPRRLPLRAHGARIAARLPQA